MHAIRTRAIAENQELWKRLMKSRRSLLRRISAIIDYLGFSVLISVAFGTISSDQVVKRIAERTGLVIKPVVCPHVEVAMDADRPNQFEMLRKDLEQRLTP